MIQRILISFRIKFPPVLTFLTTRVFSFYRHEIVNIVSKYTELLLFWALCRFTAMLSFKLT